MARVRHLDDAEAVAAALRDVPLDPVVDTVLLTVLDRCLHEPAAFPERHWWLVEDHTGIVGVAFRTPPWPLGLGLPAGPWLGDLVAALSTDPAIQEVMSERGRAEAFVAEWTARVGDSWSETVSQRLLRCVGLRPPVDIDGRARLVRAQERDLLVTWLDAFGIELDLFRHDNPALADNLLLGGLAWWWVDPDDRPVSLAAYRGPQRGVSRIGPVYTPPEHRRHGYAAAVTATATQAAYDAGSEQVVLYTDAANPTSNAVYEGIGYVRESYSVHLKLERSTS